MKLTSSVAPVDGNKRLKELLYGITIGRKAMQPNEQHSITMLLVARLAGVLVLDRFDMFLREAPVAGQLLPVLELQLIARQTPQQLAHLLREQLTVLAVAVAVASIGTLGVAGLDGDVPFHGTFVKAVACIWACCCRTGVPRPASAVPLRPYQHVNDRCEASAGRYVKSRSSGLRRARGEKTTSKQKGEGERKVSQQVSVPD